MNRNTSVEVLLTDLLPEVYRRVVWEFAGHIVMDAQRGAILQALAESIRWSVAAAKHEEWEYTQSHDGPLDSSRPCVLLTADRFTSKWAAREDLIAQIRKASGFDDRISNVALMLIEAQIDRYLSAHRTVAIVGLCSIGARTNGAEGPRGREDCSASWLADVLTRIPPAALGSRQPLFSRRFPRPSRLMAALVDSLELSAVSRPAVPYDIALLPEAKGVSPREEVVQVDWKERLQVDPMRGWWWLVRWME